jgi:hypothetical protein
MKLVTRACPSAFLEKVALNVAGYSYPVIFINELQLVFLFLIVYSDSAGFLAALQRVID